MKIKQMGALQSVTLRGTLADRVLVLCAQAKQLEEAGNFEEARQVLGEFWQRIGERPKLDGLNQPGRAELLLRAGTLSGWIGSAGQIPGAQEIAKDLISESSAIFEELELPEKVAEARVDLGTCYWREGALDEARISFDDALHRLGNIESEQRLRALLNKAIVEQVSSRLNEALQILAHSESLFASSGNQILRGKFHNEFATVLKNIGLEEIREDYIDRALMQYTAAAIEFEQAGHERLLAGVENNLGFVFARLGRFEEAHAHLDRALAVAAKSDKGRQAQFEDTRARVFLRQGQLEQAAKAAGSAVRRFREGDEQSHLATALTTNGTILARLGRHHDAVAMLNEAVAVATQVGDPETGGIAAITIIEELSSVLSADEVMNHYQSAESALRQTQQSALRSRLGECARTLLTKAAVTSATGPSQISIPPRISHDISLEEQVLAYEGEVIRHALEASDGSVTRAARLLGVTHQGLAFILNGRQKSLLSSRKPAKPRRRSIIRYH
ncbi:MAG: tetratricopeptide repeat protein [Acidobacteriota bacterium]